MRLIGTLLLLLTLLMLLPVLCRDDCANGACPVQPRRWDPLFAAAYRHASKIDIEVIRGSAAQSISAAAYIRQLLH